VAENKRFELSIRLLSVTVGNAGEIRRLCAGLSGMAGVPLVSNERKHAHRADYH
jgi:hypothetical protein